MNAIDITIESAQPVQERATAQPANAPEESAAPNRPAPKPHIRCLDALALVLARSAAGG